MFAESCLSLFKLFQVVITLPVTTVIHFFLLERMKGRDAGFYGFIKVDVIEMFKVEKKNSHTSQRVSITETITCNMIKLKRFMIIITGWFAICH